MSTFEIGSPESVAAFRRRNEEFFHGVDVLYDCLEIAFRRPFDTEDKAAAVIFYIGNRCEDDFQEIMLLAANGFGWGATAHLRGMYERAVIASYLLEHPTEVNDFIDFDFVQRWKAAQAIKRALNIDAEKDEEFAKLKEDFDSVRERFLVPDCDKCGTTRLNHTWSKLDFVSMAGKVSLKDLIVPAYYIPLSQGHGTFASAGARLSQSENGALFVDTTIGMAEADRSFQLAHLLLIGIISIQHQYFKLDQLKECLDKAMEHYQQVWLK